MSIIYEPKGKALEYSPLAINLYNGCDHACKYCYCPGIFRKTLENWSKESAPRKNIIAQLEKSAAKYANDPREILFSFTSDPYQNDAAAKLTREALLICEKHNLRCQVLTKNGMAATKDFDIIKRNNWKFGSTIIFKSESLREEWEPGAPSIESRIEAVKIAHSMGIYTWVSIEPVVDTVEALLIIEELKPYVSFWKVGKINHFPTVEKTIDWHKFLVDAESALAGSSFYIKKDLEKFRVK